MPASYIVEEDIREYLMDTSWEDNDLLLDKAFSTEELEAAMRSVVRMWNDIPPFLNSTITPDKLPSNSNVFFDGIVLALLKRKLLNLTRNDIDYNAGNMQVSFEAKHIQHIKSLIPYYEAKFEQAAKAIKTSANLRSAYGPVG